MRRTLAVLFFTAVFATMPALTGVASLHAMPSGTGMMPPAKTAHRVIALSPHITELIFAAGAGDKLIATVSSSNYPPQALALPRVGDGLSVNVEQLLALKPDLVFAWHPSLAMQKLTPTLAGLGVFIDYFAPNRLDDIPADIEKLGERLGTATQAHAIAQQLREQLNQLRKRYAHRTKVSVFIEIGMTPLYTLGNDPLINDVIASCGGSNIFADSSLVAPTVTIETILARQPDVVIIADSAPEYLTARNHYWHGLQLQAARTGAIHAIDPDTLLRPGPRLIEAARQLCEYMDQVR